MNSLSLLACASLLLCAGQAASAAPVPAVPNATTHIDIASGTVRKCRDDLGARTIRNMDTVRAIADTPWTEDLATLFLSGPSQPLKGRTELGWLGQHI